MLCFDNASSEKSCFVRDLVFFILLRYVRYVPLKHYKPLACEKTMNFSRRGEVCPLRASGISGIVLHAALGETNIDLQAKSLNGKDEK